MLEELSDGITFFSETMIMNEISEKELKPIDKFQRYSICYSNLENKLWEITYLFSMAANRLKNKPWKKTQVLTDVDKFKSLLIIAYNRFMEIINSFGFDGKQILEIYIKKHLVNKFRVRSNY